MYDPWEALQRRNEDVLSQLEDAWLDPDEDEEEDEEGCFE